MCNANCYLDKCCGSGEYRILNSIKLVWEYVECQICLGLVNRKISKCECGCGNYIADPEPNIRKVKNVR